MSHNKRVKKRGITITSKENLASIIASLPPETTEIAVIKLPSQFHKKQKVSLSRNGNNQR